MIKMCTEDNLCECYETSTSSMHVCKYHGRVSLVVPILNERSTGCNEASEDLLKNKRKDVSLDFFYLLPTFSLPH